jgi:aminoglycoside phosphotransferase (APT) family kinase protein
MGRFLRALHDGAVPDGAVPDGIADAPGPEAEAALTARAWEHAVRLHPDLGPALRNVLDIAIVAAGAAGPRSLLHGDVKIEHLLDAGDRLAVIDLDSVAVGDPLRDVGRLLASLWWEERRWSDERSPGHDRAVTGAGIRGALLAAYDPADRLDRRALGGWTALALLKQAARRVPVLDPGLGAGLARWLDVASVACSGDVT